MDPVVLYAILRQRRKRRHNYWVHPLNLKRDIWGEHLKVIEMMIKYPDKFHQYTRMTQEKFQYLLRLLEDDISKQDTNFRKAIPTDFRLFVTLRYLATGDSIVSIATSYSMGVTTVWRIIRLTTPLIWEKLNNFVQAPKKESEWLQIAKRFHEAWNFPNCLGAIDGKHIDIEAPANSGSMYFNYKSRFSIVLLATCDADYRFTTVDIGAYGKQSDSGVFAQSGLGQLLESGNLNLPGPNKLPNSDKILPYAFVGDEAFPLKCYMMRPFPGRNLSDDQRIFNYRLSRARRIIENAFGILAKRFRIFRRPISAAPLHVMNLVKACVALHNYLRSCDLSQRGANQYIPQGFADSGDENNGTWRRGSGSSVLRNVNNMSSNNAVQAAKEMRNILTEYFVNEGKVEWQRTRVGLD